MTQGVLDFGSEHESELSRSGDGEPTEICSLSCFSRLYWAIFASLL